MTGDIRPAAMAGMWYPASADRLGREVDRYMADATIDTLPAPRAIVAPHAGLRYSGPVAAFAYKAVSRHPYGAAVLVGPSHFVGFSGVSIWPRGAWETPFGPVHVAEELAGQITSASPEVVELRQAHGREHSLEMQMPFVAHLLPGVPIVPMVMGHQSRETAFGLGDALARVLSAREGGPEGPPLQPDDRKGRPSGRPEPDDRRGRPSGRPEPDDRRGRPSGRPDVLLVASSDLSHFENALTAARMDSVVVDHVERIDADGLMQALEKEPHHACGGGPMVAVLHAARQLGATTARVLKYGDSGDVSGDKSSVVGYMAAAIW